MGTAYLKTFNIAGTTWGIEDHGDGKPGEDHFFHHDYLAGRRKRFAIWRSGCGCGQFETLAQAEAGLRERVLADLMRRKNTALDEVALVEPLLFLISAGGMETLQCRKS